MDEYGKLESDTFAPATIAMPLRSHSQLNIIDEGDLEDFEEDMEEDMEVGEYDIDDNFSNFGGAGAKSGTKFRGGRWELKRRK